jgi:hypothetical protein
MRILFLFLIAIHLSLSLQAQNWQALGADDYNQASENPMFGVNSLVRNDSIFTTYNDLKARKTCVKLFDGAHWMELGKIPTHNLHPFNLLAGKNGALYVSYYHGALRGIKKFNGAGWADIHPPNAWLFDADSAGNPYCLVKTGTSYTVMKYNGSVWNAQYTPVTISNLYYFKTDPTGKPYLAYFENDYWKFKTFTGGNWAGLDSISSSFPVSTLFRLDKQGTPFICFGGEVYKWNGTTWTVLAAPYMQGTSPLTTSCINFDKANVLHAIGYEPGAGFTIKKYNGTAWVAAFPSLSSSGYGLEESALNFDTANTPIVLLTDNYRASKATVKKLDGSNQWVMLGEAGFTKNTGDVSMDVDSTGIPYLMLIDSSKIKLRKLNGAGWDLYGYPGPDSYGFDAFRTAHLKLSPSGIPYVIHQTYAFGPGYQGFVRKYTAGIWQTVGASYAPGISTGNIVLSGTLDFHDSDTPYVCYKEASSLHKANVKKYNGSGWVYAAPANFSPQGASNTCMVKTDSCIYVAFDHRDSAKKACVMSYKNGVWQYAGGLLSQGEAADISIAADSNGLPYVLYVDEGTGGKAFVKTFENNSWVLLGGTPVSEGPTLTACLRLDKNGFPYVLLRDSTQDGRGTMRRFNGDYWETVGLPGFTAGCIANCSFAIAGNTIFAAYASAPLYPNYINEHSDVFTRYIQVPISGHITTATNGSCAGATISFTAKAYFAGTNISYQWKRNGVNVGGNTNTYSSAGLVNGDSIVCVITQTTAPFLSVTTNSIIVNRPDPALSIVTAITAMCTGTPAVLRAIVLPDTTTGVSYQWYKNNTAVGTNSNLFTTAALSPTDQVKCIMTHACGTDTSNIISIPAFAVSLSGNPCSSEPLRLISNAALSSIAWQLDGQVVKTNYATRPTSTIAAGTAAAGSGLDMLNAPSGIFVAGNGNLFIADGANNRVMKYLPGAAQGVVVAGGNGAGSSLNQLNKPSGLWLVGSNLYISDQNNHRVVKWVVGTTAGVIVAGGNGQGAAANQLNTPAGIYVNASGDLFIADQFNNRVQKFASGATIGTTVAGQSSGQGGSALNTLSRPWGLYAETNGDLYISDQINDRVVKWGVGATTGVLVAGGNGAGAALNQLNRPAGVWRDVSGYTYISDALNARVIRWQNGAVTGEVIGAGAQNILSKPQGLVINKQGVLYVADQGAYNRVRRYLPKMDTTFTTMLQATTRPLLKALQAAVLVPAPLMCNPPVSPHRG